MNSEITNAVDAADDKAQYDACAKRLLANKSILGHILVNTIDEFKGMAPEEAEKYIEGDPIISAVPVDPGLTNAEKRDPSGKRLVGLNTESAEINEGMIRYDIIFYVRMRECLSQIIANIEAQKDNPKSYKILNRAIYYVCRLISSQKERDFENSNYDDIKQVYSIWICMNMDHNSLCHISLTKKDLLEPCDWEGNLNLLNIVMVGVTDEVPERDKKFGLHRLISALLSNELPEQEKLDIIKKEYNIPIEEEIREDVSVMCNLSEGVWEKGMKKGMEAGMKKGMEKGAITEREKFILSMHQKGFSLDQIADVAGISTDEVNSVITKKAPAMA
ncbi:MAG: hypothetical protein ACI4CS_09170 [Candidatus Weimeria sp.]